MATNEPPERKRKIEKSMEEKTFYVMEEAVKKGSEGGYVSPPPCESDEDVDPALEEAYYRQISESGGFDCDVYIPNGSLLPFKCSDTDRDEIGICAKIGLHWYNLLKGSTYRLLRLQNNNSILTSLLTNYITADVIDPATTNSCFVFQTCVVRSSCQNNEDFRIETESFSIKGETQGSEYENCHWNYEEIDDFYKGDLKWLLDNALVQSSDKQQQQYYELQDSDIRENDWVHLYVEYVFFPLWEEGRTKLKFGTPLEIMKIVVQTRDAMEPKEKLKAGNAYFYISFRDCGKTEEHRAVVRRTTDGHPGHICLEVKCLAGDLTT